MPLEDKVQIFVHKENNRLYLMRQINLHQYRMLIFDEHGCITSVDINRSIYERIRKNLRIYNGEKHNSYRKVKE